jgi:hypothetical protein
MAASHYGDDGTTAITWYPNQPTKEREGDVWSYVWRGWCATDSAETLIPDDLEEMPGDADYLLKTAAIADTSAPGIVDITLTYTYKGGSKVDPRDPEDIEQRSEVISLQIGRANAYDAGGELQDRAEAAMNDQEDEITVGGLRYEYGYDVTDFEWSEANLVASSGLDGGDIKAPGELGQPSGLTGAVTANVWMYRGKRIERKSKRFVRIGEQWEYNPVGWK